MSLEAMSRATNKDIFFSGRKVTQEIFCALDTKSLLKPIIFVSQKQSKRFFAKFAATGRLENTTVS